MHYIECLSRIVCYDVQCTCTCVSTRVKIEILNYTYHSGGAAEV